MINEFRSLEEYKSNMKEIGFEVVWEDLPWKDMGDVLFENINLWQKLALYQLVIKAENI